MSVSVVVAHRHALVAEGIAAALARCPGVVPTGWTTDAVDALRLGERADAVVVDPELSGAARAARMLRRLGVRVVFVGDAREDAETVSPDASVTELAAALDPRSDELSRDRWRLTRREREVLSLIAQGFAGKQVARQLGISPKTVERHKTKIFTKLAVPNAAAAVGVLVSELDGGEGAWSRSTT